MLNFLIIGDWGRKGTPGQIAVADGMAHLAERLGSRFVISTGDNFYDGVTGLRDDHWQESYEAVYDSPSLQIPWYMVLGNHDYQGCVQAQLDYAQLSTRWRLPARYYAVEQAIDPTASALLVFLDTSPFVSSYQAAGPEYIESLRGSAAEPQLLWLQATLAASNAAWKLVFGHHPIYSASPIHGDTFELKHHLLPILHAHHVQAYVCGHEHDLQHLSVDGVDYVVSGAGAECRESGWRRESRCSVSKLGFSAVSLTGDCLRVEFYDADGNCLYAARRLLCSLADTADGYGRQPASVPATLWAKT
jgi:tartrate-resistant acid phosphatase type 5